VLQVSIWQSSSSRRIRAGTGVVCEPRVIARRTWRCLGDSDVVIVVVPPIKRLGVRLAVAGRGRGLAAAVARPAPPHPLHRSSQSRRRPYRRRRRRDPGVRARAPSDGRGVPGNRGRARPRVRPSAVDVASRVGAALPQHGASVSRHALTRRDRHSLSSIPVTSASGQRHTHTHTHTRLTALCPGLPG